MSNEKETKKPKASPAKTDKKTTKKTKKPKKKGMARFLNFLKFLLIFMVVGGLIAAGVVYTMISAALKDLPPIDPSSINDLLTENSVIVDANGNVLESIKDKNLRKIIKYDDISQSIIDAFVAVEDKTFFEHSGFNYIRLIGAVVESVTSGNGPQGTSTITQQLARNLYLEETRLKRDMSRKIQEAYYTLILERQLEKDQILEAYLNTINLGGIAHGVEAASQRFFSKSASELGTIEAAILAGIPSSPLNNTPILVKNKEDVTADDYVLDDSGSQYTIVYNERCEQRYKTVIYLMFRNGKIDEAEYNAALNVDLREYLNLSKEASADITSYFADMVKDEVIQDLMAQYDLTYAEAQKSLYRGGYTIYSTIDLSMQKQLEQAYSIQNFTKYFGDTTRAAVMDYQKSRNIAVDGSVGKGTLATMAEEGLINAEDFPNTPYTKGVAFEEVIKLKEVLFNEGFITGSDNIPKINVDFDDQQNIVSLIKNDKKQVIGSNLLMYKYSNVINDDNRIMIPNDEYFMDARGNLVLKKYNRLRIDGSNPENIRIFLQTLFTYDEDNSQNYFYYGGKNADIVSLYTFNGLYDTIGPKYKSLDEDGNVVISKSFLDENPDFAKVEADGSLTIEEKFIQVADEGIIQPQSAMVIIDYRTGQLKAIVGGRNVEGQKIYNRAINPRQPGSSVKPLTVYTPAIESKEYTAATVLDDIPVYMKPQNPEERWPLNWYESYGYDYQYKGLQTVRDGIRYSLNVVTALIADDLGIDYCLDYLRKFGITTIVDEGPVNDHNLSAVSLGGMAQGAKPIEMTAAYGAIANGGVLNETHTYTKVVDNSGKVILEKTPKQTFVVDKEVAYIIQDMMWSSVNEGFTDGAKLASGMPVAGKTGTTSNQFDVWFIGQTPYYVGGVWFGNDINMPLTEGSAISAKFWSQVMTQVHEELPIVAFDKPENLDKVLVDTRSGKLPSELSYRDQQGNNLREEYFLKGTAPTEVDDVHVLVNVCSVSNQLVTGFCPPTTVEERVMLQLPTPYDPKEHLLDPNRYVPEGEDPIYVYPVDYEFRVPVEECDVHTGMVADETLITKYEGYKVLIPLPNGNKIIQIPFNATLVDGKEIIIPIGSMLLPSGDIQLPDESIIYTYNLLDFPTITDDMGVQELIDLGLINAPATPDATTESSTTVTP